MIAVHAKGLLGRGTGDTKAVGARAVHCQFFHVAGQLRSKYRPTHGRPRVLDMSKQSLSLAFIPLVCQALQLEPAIDIVQGELGLIGTHNERV